MDYPYHLEIGSHLRTVLEWRRDVVEIAASQDRRLQRELIKCCREDTLFFFKGFVDLFEPRLGDEGANESQVVPFIPWPHQVDAIQYADQWMGKRDIRVNKSRAQGGFLPVLDDVPAPLAVPPDVQGKHRQQGPGRGR